MFEKTINTSRKRAISAPAGSKSARSRGSVQRVELTVDDRPYSQVLHNGVRPHGGYRGTNKHPPGLYSEYENPLDQFSLTQPLPSSATPSETSTMPTAWMSSMFKESSHSEESPLFIHKLLSPDKSIQKGRSSMSARRSANSSKGSRCSSSVHYYRPDRVLRARERCTSVPVNAYDARKELLRKLENRYRSAQANSAGFSWKKSVIQFVLS
ncbi:hypothetical protein CAPTEDRAFT_218685 [Capitella teleta]|uniref:Uncharacterized protein n=1 Tax=Capitella teleta TaxID=283909 RepID=R7VLE0_CAPTE|nr:hypothetical protein CAPTEDRAFT_218685 [Capitella teleta]|eukprot:ELU18161.1 hypothetical protein CAPTEDRAFT_218685 [Capitella teleta]